ncbi:hypothetical protein BJ912DRAFT_1067242 [Pholiota molesta]|nr:hypothetical protein BJ912DRAFT_1067242 [Pholiota molesta]
MDSKVFFDRGINFASDDMAANGSFCRGRAAAYGRKRDDDDGDEADSKRKDEADHDEDDEQKGEGQDDIADEVGGAPARRSISFVNGGLLQHPQNPPNPPCLCPTLPLPSYFLPSPSAAHDSIIPLPRPPHDLRDSHNTSGPGGPLELEERMRWRYHRYSNECLGIARLHASTPAPPLQHSSTHDRDGSLYPVAITLSGWHMDPAYVIASCCWCGTLHYCGHFPKIESPWLLFDGNDRVPVHVSVFYRKKYLSHSNGEFSPTYTSVLLLS